LSALNARDLLIDWLVSREGENRELLLLGVNYPRLNLQTSDWVARMLSGREMMILVF